MIFALCNFHFPLFSRNQKGFTLVELIIALLIGSVLALTVGMILFTTRTSWSQGWEKLNLQRDASYAMYRMERVIRAGSQALVESGGTSLKIYSAGAWERFFQDDIDLKYEKEGWTDPETIINGKVDDLTFVVSGNKEVEIDLTLKKHDLEANFVTMVKCRN